MLKKYLELLEEVKRLEQEDKEVILYNNWKTLKEEYLKYTQCVMSGAWAFPSDEGKESARKLLEYGVTKEEIHKECNFYTIREFLPKEEE